MKTVFEWIGSALGLATRTDLQQLERNIMSAISDYAAAQAAFNTRLETAIDGITADIAALAAKIEELQNTPGLITPEDQALLDELQAKAKALAEKMEALDSLNPPPAPTEG